MPRLHIFAEQVINHFGISPESVLYRFAAKDCIAFTVEIDRCLIDVAFAVGIEDCVKTGKEYAGVVLVRESQAI